MYNILNEKSDLVIRDCRHLILINEKLSVKHSYENISEPDEIPSQKTNVPSRTDISSNIVTPSVRTKPGRIIRKIKRYLEEC